MRFGKAQDADAPVAALALVYVAIDTMAFLACPLGQDQQTRADFIGWVDQYLKAEAGSEYQYEGIDVYAARCAALHSYGSVAAVHSSAHPPRKFGYADHGPHRTDEAERFFLVSIAVLTRDLGRAMEAFMSAARSDPELKRRIDSRVTSLFFTKLIQH